MKKSLFLAGILVSLFSATVPAQVGSPGNYEKYEFQPEAWSFPEYKSGDTDPHGNFVTSVPVVGISAPSGIGMDISLSYNSDIHYADPAGWIGLGWKWNPGTITRSVQGGFLTDPALTSEQVFNERFNLFRKCPVDFPSNIDNDLWDQNIDIFSINLPDGRSAKFVLDGNQTDKNRGYDNFISLGTENWAIRGYYKNNAGPGLLTQCARFTIFNDQAQDVYGKPVNDYYAFIIRDENGVQYIFREPTEEIATGKNGAKALYYSTWRISWIIDKCEGQWINPETLSFASLEKGIKYTYDEHYREFLEYTIGEGGHQCADILRGGLSDKKYLTMVETINQRISFEYVPDDDLDPTQFLVFRNHPNGNILDDLSTKRVTRKRIKSISLEKRTGNSSWNLSQKIAFKTLFSSKRTFLSEIVRFAPDGNPVELPYEFTYESVGNESLEFTFDKELYAYNSDYGYNPFNAYWDINGYFKNSLTRYSSFLEPTYGQLKQIKYPNGRTDDIKYLTVPVFSNSKLFLQGLYWKGFWGNKEENTGIFEIDLKKYFNEEVNPSLGWQLDSLVKFFGYNLNKLKEDFKYPIYFDKPVVLSITASDPTTSIKKKVKNYLFIDPVFKGIPREVGFEKPEAIRFYPNISGADFSVISAPKMKRASRLSSVDDQVWFRKMEVAETGLPNQATEWSFQGQDYYLVIGPFGSTETSSSLFASNHDDIFFEYQKTTDSDGSFYFANKIYSKRKNTMEYKGLMPFTQPSNWHIGQFVSVDLRPILTITEDGHNFPQWTLSGMKYTHFTGSIPLGEASWLGYNSEQNETEFKFSYMVQATTYYPNMGNLNLLNYPGIEMEGFIRVPGRVNASFVFPWQDIDDVIRGKTPPAGNKINVTSQKVTTYYSSSQLGYLPKEIYIARTEKPSAFVSWNSSLPETDSDWLKLSEIASYTTFGQPSEVVSPFVKEKIWFGNAANRISNDQGNNYWYKPTGRQIFTLSDSLITTFQALYNENSQLETVIHNTLMMEFTYDYAGKPVGLFRNGKLIRKNEWNLLRDDYENKYNSNRFLWSASKLYNSTDESDWTGTAIYYDAFGQVQTVSGSPTLSMITEPLFDRVFRPTGQLIPFERMNYGLDYDYDLTVGSNIQGEYWTTGGLCTGPFTNQSKYTDSKSPEYRNSLIGFEINLLDESEDENYKNGFSPFSFSQKSIGGDFEKTWKPGFDLRINNRYSFRQKFRKGDFRYLVSVDENQDVIRVVKTDFAGRERESGIAIPITNLALLRFNMLLHSDTTFNSSATSLIGNRVFENKAILDPESLISLNPIDVPNTELNAGYNYFDLQPGEIQRIKIASLPAGVRLTLVNHWTKEVAKVFTGPLSNYSIDLPLVPGLYEMEVLNTLNLANSALTGGITGFAWSISDAELEQKVKFEYDNYGRLKSVTHPDGTQTSYRYDFFGNILKKETPFHEGKIKKGAKPESDPDENPDFEFGYDRFGRLRFSIDPNQSVAGRMSYFKYDFLSRPVEQGTVISAGNFTSAKADDATYPTQTGSSNNPISIQKNPALDKPARDIVSLGPNQTVQMKVYYDLNLNLHGFQLENGLGKPGYKIEYSPNPDGKFRPIRTYYSYTPEGWIKSVTEISDTVTKVEKFTGYDLQGKLKSSQVLLSGKLLQKRRFDYDGLSRLSRVSVIHTGRTDSVVLTTERLNNGQWIKTKNQSGTYNNESVLDVRGWLTSLSSESSKFREELFYFGSGIPTGITPNYNGNISYIRTTNQSITDPNTTPTVDTLGFGYKYDRFNRLISVKTYRGAEILSNRFNSDYSYDIMGNLISQNKKSWDNSLKQVLELDNLVYQYAGTRLMNVIDKVKTTRSDDYETTLNSISGSPALENTVVETFEESFTSYPAQTGKRPVSAKWDAVGFYGSTDPDAGVSIVNQSGNLVLLLKPVATSGSTKNSASLRSKVQSVIGGRVYTLSGTYKGVAVTGDEITTYPAAYVGVEWLRADYSRISVQYVVSNGKQAAWTVFSGNLTAPAEGAFVRVLVINYLATGTEIYADNLVFKESGFSFAYDSNGNLVQDLNRQIQSMTYNSQNLPEKITKTNGSLIYYGYNFSGQRIWKKVGTDTWFYLRDASGAILAEYKNSSANLEYVNLMAGGSETIGQSRLESGIWKRYYYIKDHLGNVRQTLRDDGTKATVVSTEDYYPFGASLRSSTSQLPALDKFKYQGKERDLETGYDYFEARLYDSQLGRFMQVDPLAEKFKTSNPFVGMGNNPIQLVDPTGMAAGDFYSVDGEWLGSDGVDDDKVYTTTKETVKSNELEINGEKIVDWDELKEDKNTKDAGKTQEYLDKNGATISNDRVSKNLVGFAIYMRNVEGISNAKVILNGPRSGDRDEKTNKQVHGAKGSAHLKNQAADIHVKGVGDRALAIIASKSNLFDGVVYHSVYSGRQHAHVDFGDKNYRSYEGLRGDYFPWSSKKNSIILGSGEFFEKKFKEITMRYIQK